MRKTNLILFFTLVAIGFASCKKETKTPGESGNSELQFAPPFTYYVFGTDITEDDFLKAPDDDACEKFNYVDYALTLGMLEIYQHHGDLLADLMSSMRGTPNLCYNLFQFASEHPAVNQIYDSVFAARFSNFSTYGDWKGFVQANYIYDTTYIPYVRFANLGTIDFSLPAYAAAPLEINEEKFTNFDDDLPMWINNGTSMLFTTINEANAALVQNPILLTANAFSGAENIQNPTVPDFPPIPSQQPKSCGLTNPPSPHIHEKISHTKFKINHRYESAGRSEYNFVFIAAKTYVQSNNNWGNWAGNIIQHEKKVKKSEIGTTLFFNFEIFFPTYYASPFCIDINMLTLSHLYDKNFVVAAYERDWAFFYKPILTVTYAGQPVQYESRRRFYGDWYYWHPEYNDYYDFMTRNPTPGSQYVNTTKGEVWLTRHY